MAGPGRTGLYLHLRGQFFYYVGLKHLEATRAAVTATMEPVMAAGIAWLWWGEYFSPLGYAGSALVLMSVLLMMWDGTRTGT
ncbi:EamA family transporter [Desulfonema ishimotonii]|uniref:EamA family transporter n=2 Tax=Desulfonema ishimotonii TaxID=45657 RepID=A0A401G0I9_9BACT|nr:EamA family transporter [Desulfonema ishimotonii]